MIANKVEQSIFIIDADDRIEWVNESFIKNFGWTQSDVVGKKPTEILGGEHTDMDQIRAMDKAIFEDKVPYNATIAHYRKDGSMFWGKVYVTPILDERGELARYMAISQDVTKEIEAEQAIEESEYRFQQITYTIDECFYLFNIADQQYEFMSPNSIRVMGAPPEFFYSREERHVDRYVHEDDKEIVRAANVKVDNGEAYEIEYRIRVGDRVKWVRERSFPISDGDGNVVKNSGICEDITDRKEESARLEHANRKAKILADIGLKITASLALSDAMDFIHEQVSQLMDASMFGIGIVDKDKNEIHYPRFIEKNKDYTDVHLSLADDTLSGKCVRSGEEMLINSRDDISKYISDPDEYEKGDPAQSIIYLPLNFKGEIVGVITVQSWETNAYDDEQVDILRSIAVYTANSIAHQRLYDELARNLVEKVTD